MKINIKTYRYNMNPIKSTVNSARLDRIGIRYWALVVVSVIQNFIVVQ